MSLNPTKLDVVQVRDPRTILTNKREFAVLKSGSQTTWKQYTSTSVSQSSIQFSCPPPSGSVIMDRKVYFTLGARLTFTGIPPIGQAILQPGRDAPRAFPLSGSIDTWQISINNESVSINLADIIHPLMHYNTGQDVKSLDYSLTPSTLDQSQQYSDLFGTTRNPLGGYGDSNDHDCMGRGGFPYVVVQNPTQTIVGTLLTAIVDIVVCEPIFLSPFYFGRGNASGFYNVISNDYNITFLGGSYAANRWWSHDSNGGTNNITSLTLAFSSLLTGVTPAFSYQNAQPVLLFQYITPQETQMLSPNMSISYPYFDIQRYPTDYGSNVNPGVNITMNSNNLQLSSIPRRIYIYVRQRNSDLFNSCTNTDTYFQINNVSIQFLNKNGLLSSASSQQLYEMSVENGCNLSWSQWYGQGLGKVGIPTPTNLQINGIGSVLMLNLPSNIGLDVLDAPGKLLQIMFQVTISCTNLSSSPISPTLYVVPVLDGTFTIDRLGQCSRSIGVITSQDVLDSQSSPTMTYQDVEQVGGGNFLDGLKNFFSKANNFLKDNKIISSVMSAFPLTAPFSPIARNLGYGDGGCSGYGVMAGDGVMAGEGVLLGGKSMSRAQMRRRLMR